MLKVDEPLVEWARRPANRVRKKSKPTTNISSAYRHSNQAHPMAIDEWAYTGGGTT
jgi:hypothetical protein